MKQPPNEGMKRRSFLGSILAAGVAPAFVGSSVLMPVRKIVVPEWRDLDKGWRWWIAPGEGVYIDTHSTQGGDGSLAQPYRSLSDWEDAGTKPWIYPKIT